MLLNKIYSLVHVTIPGYCCCCRRSLGISWVRCGYSGGLLNAVTSTSPGLSQKVWLFGWRKETNRRMALVIWLQKRNETNGVTIDQRCQPFSHGGTPKITFIIPRNKYLWTSWQAKNGWARGGKIQLLLNCQETLFLKKARRFVCGRQGVCSSALNADKCLLSRLLSAGISCRQGNQIGSFAVFEDKHYFSCSLDTLVKTVPLESHFYGPGEFITVAVPNRNHELALY
jgi:hypothetical protein